MSRDIQFHKKKVSSKASIQLPVSKSECNRAQIISFLSGQQVTLKNYSDAKDSKTLFNLLAIISDDKTGYLNCGPAGTTFRFILAVAAGTPGKWNLTGSERMKERPIGILVDALRTLGAEIIYDEKDGYPPLTIHGKTLKGGKINLDASISSQFISSLMLMAPNLKEGLHIDFNKKPVSFPYLQMTAAMMKTCGAKVELTENYVTILPNYYTKTEIICENDWSAASYFYSLVAVNPDLNLTISGLRKESLQGDSVVQIIYELFGVETIFTQDGIQIFNNKTVTTDYFEYDFTDCPDLAQTLAFTCTALRIDGRLNGLSTLKNKETDRIEALKTEMEKCGMNCNTGNDFISFMFQNPLPQSVIFNTYEDHRMAMSESVIATVCNEVLIKDGEVVEKSFPDFWSEIKKIF